jgi:hypothetical protein
MKTAMQELKEWVIKNKEHQQGSESGEQSVCDFEYCDFYELVLQIEALIVNERQQILDSNDRGYQVGTRNIEETANDYYEETYKK